MAGIAKSSSSLSQGRKGAGEEGEKAPGEVVGEIARLGKLNDGEGGLKEVSMKL